MGHDLGVSHENESLPGLSQNPERSLKKVWSFKQEGEYIAIYLWLLQTAFRWHLNCEASFGPGNPGRLTGCEEPEGAFHALSLRPEDLRRISDLLSA